MYMHCGVEQRCRQLSLSLSLFELTEMDTWDMCFDNGMGMGLQEWDLLARRSTSALARRAGAECDFDKVQQ